MSEQTPVARAVGALDALYDAYERGETDLSLSDQARAVFESIDRDGLARVLWPYPYAWESALPEHQEFYHVKAGAVLAWLTGEK